MTNPATKTYLVGVIERAIAYYKIEAEDARTAAENWDDGEYHDRDDGSLESEGPCNVREQKTDGSWVKLPPSEWEADSEIARFDDYEIEPRIRHWDDGDPERPDHSICGEEEADMWRLYGNSPGQDSICIGEFGTRALAEEVYTRLTGRRYGSPS